MPKISQCVKKFLEDNTYSDLANLYSEEMEMQIMVAKDEGIKEGNYYKEEEGINKWHNIRIPKNANTDPINNNTEMPFDLAKHTLGIGMTGWDWINRKSIWVGYDFDAIIGHSDKHSSKLSEAELAEIIKKIQDIPYVTVRRSTSGNGLHLYIFVNNIPTSNHNEHAALARFILGQLSIEAGYNFESKVDAMGTVLWQWHRKMIGTKGLKLIKYGRKLENVPDDWKLHIPIISGKKKKVVPLEIPEEIHDEFLELTGQRNYVKFDLDHKKLLEWLQNNGFHCAYNQDLHLITTHTHALKAAHQALQLKSKFETISEGTEEGDRNCFMYPLPNGGWTIKRFTRGVQEHELWDQDKSGYTSIVFNKEPDLYTASKIFGGAEMSTGGFSFPSVKDILKLGELLGISFNIPEWAWYKSVIIKRHEDGRLLIKLEADTQKDSPHGGLKGFSLEGKYWCKFYSTKVEDRTNYEISNYDDTIRHLLTPIGDDAGWAIRVSDHWQNEPITHVSKVLKALGHKHTEVERILGNRIIKSWRLVFLPFQSEYPGNRQWNRNAPQFRFGRLENLDNLHYPTWNKILNHLGKSLDKTVSDNKWCKENNIYDGASYLKVWIASLFQHPTEPLPYLFFFGPEMSGKSSFHEAISLLVTKGVRRADTAVLSKNDFTAELEDSILCVIEDKSNLKANKNAMNRLRDWVTSPKIVIHKKGIDPYEVANQTHWVQTSNNSDYLPIFPGDTRVTVIFVNELKDIIPRNIFYSALEKEASDFLTEVLSIEVPESQERLRIPVIITEDKIRLQENTQSELEQFIEEFCYYIPGAMVKFGDFFDRFQEWLDPNSVHLWSKIRVTREMPARNPVGQLTSEANQRYICNLSWTNNETEGKPLTVRDRKITSA
jgi:hypothetical protein